MIDKIKKHLGECEIAFVFRTGSRLFCKHCNDEDLCVVVKNWDLDSQYFRIENACVFCYSVREFERFAKMQLRDYRDLYSIAVLFAKGENVLYGENPLENYSWWNYRTDAVRRLLEIGSRSFFSPRALKQEIFCQTKMYWAFATYFVLINNSTEFTAEQKALLQQCHDGRLLSSNRDKLKEDLLRLGAKLFAA